MACSRRSSWLGASMPMFALLLLASFHFSTSTDFLLEAAQEPPTTLSENTLRHIMQLVSLGTGVSVPSPLSLRYREKSLKRARLGATHPRPQTEFVMGSEFLGKRSSQEDKRMGSEFLGKRMGSEFLGKRMGSEFLGKRMGSEFLGKRMGSEFLGKRMGSEFLGKRMGSEFLGKRSDSEDDERMDYSSDKRMGSEFLGKRSDEVDDEVDLKRIGSNNQEKELVSDNRPIIFEDHKRMGSEFLGRKRRDTKTSDRQTNGA